MGHTTYVLASYAIAGATVIGLVLFVYLGGRKRQRELARLEASGIRRRSASSQPAPENAQ